MTAGQIPSTVPIVHATIATLQTLCIIAPSATQDLWLACRETDRSLVTEECRYFAAATINCLLS
jgi:hypothetical protein